MNLQKLKLSAALAAMFVFGQPAHASGIPVIDVANLGQAMQQVIHWGDQLRAMASQLHELKTQTTRLKETFDAVNGLRTVANMHNADLLYQYLPEDYATALRELKSGKGAFAAMAAKISSVVSANQHHSCAASESLKARQEDCEAEWQRLGLRSQLGDVSYQKASSNIKDLQDYVTAITTGAVDAKTMQDIQGRLAIEQVRMANEQVKLQSMQNMAAAEDEMRRRASIDAFSRAYNTGAAAKIAF